MAEDVRWQRTFIDSPRKRIISREINIAARRRCPRLRNDIKVFFLFSRSLRCNRSAGYPIAALVTRETSSIKLHSLYEYRNDHSRSVGRIPRLFAETAISKIRKPRSAESLPECSLPARSGLSGPVQPRSENARHHARHLLCRIVPRNQSFPLMQWIRAAQRDYHVTRFRHWCRLPNSPKAPDLSAALCTRIHARGSYGRAKDEGIYRAKICSVRETETCREGLFGSQSAPRVKADRIWQRAREGGRCGRRERWNEAEAEEKRVGTERIAG